MFDAALHFGAKAQRASRILDTLSLKPREYVLATLHRAENTDNRVRLAAIIRGLEALSAVIQVVLPLHPRTRSAIRRAGLLRGNSIRMIDPVGYLDMVMLERHARLITTDSGGVQKEAYFYRVPCATLRNETEWVELVESGWNALVPPTSADGVYRRLSRILRGFRPPRSGKQLYGNGKAATVILQHLKNA